MSEFYITSLNFIYTMACVYNNLIYIKIEEKWYMKTHK